MRWAYSVVMWLLQPLLLLRVWLRGAAEPLYRQHLGERFGYYGKRMADAPPPGFDWTDSAAAVQPLVWVHAVSLGETRAVGVLVQAMRARLPGMRLLFTHGTATGRAEGVAWLLDGDEQAWLPWDTPGAVLRFLRHYRPSVGVLVETEIWPNLVHSCRTHRVPLVLVNARLSDRSLRRAQRLAWLARPAYSGLAAVFAQTHADAQRLRAIGAPVEDVLGNLKFDVNPSVPQVAQGFGWRGTWQAGRGQDRPIVLFASSREGEEAIFLAQLRQMDPARRAQVQWLLVPRHPQRFDEVEGLVVAAGLQVSRRGAWDAEGPANLAEAADVWLGDSMGEMPLYYGMSDLALLGGSFMPMGGQNLIEAAACGCPVIMGPHVFNFADAAENSAQAGAAFFVRDLAEGVDTALDLAAKPDLLAQCRQAARKFVMAHQGAANRTAAVVARLV